MGCLKMGLREGVTTTLWAKSFIRVDYSSTSLLSCARIVNSCPSYAKRSTLRTKQCFLFFKFSWSHLPSCPGSSPFILPEHSHHHQTHGTASIPSPGTKPPRMFSPGKGCWLVMLTKWGMCALEDCKPPCSPQKSSEGINELSGSNVLKSAQLFIFLREASQGPRWNLNHRAQTLKMWGQFPKKQVLALASLANI